MTTLTAAHAAPPDRAPIHFHKWSSPRDFYSGASEGVQVQADSLRLARPVGTVPHPGPEPGSVRHYDYARWTSPPHAAAAGATQMVASWNARTPAGTWLQVEMRARTTSGAQTRWYSLGQWASGDADILRTSVDGQSDQHGQVKVDTFVTRPGTALADYQLRATLYRAAGTRGTPTVSMVGAMTSALPDRFDVPTSGPGGAWGVELRVPRYSQNVHKGHFPQFGGGGEAWCSPTSTEMVVEYWGKRPSNEDLAWVGSHPDPTVDHAARGTYDHAYDGTGNWPFNAAYAASYGLDAHITRLSSLTDLERYVRHGVPVITSQSFRADELVGAPYDTEGHIMVIVGFTPEGDVITHDPASDNDEAVRNVYRRDQFEDVWLRTKRHNADGTVADGPGGVAYLISPHHFSLSG
jgi:hypothetical protein